MMLLYYRLTLLFIINTLAATERPTIARDLQHTIPEGHQSLKDKRTIQHIIVHYTAVDLETTIGIFQGKRFDANPKTVSIHYIIARDGKLISMVDEKNIAYHAKSDINPTSIGIEHVALPGERLTPEQERTSASLIRYLPKKYNLPIQAVHGHGWIGSNIGTTPCPGSLWKSPEDLQNWLKKHIECTQ